jgi:hypothetical protein
MVLVKQADFRVDLDVGKIATAFRTGQQRRSPLLRILETRARFGLSRARVLFLAISVVFVRVCVNE